MSTPLVLLRAFELNIHLVDLEEMTLGLLLDILAERANDHYEWELEATEEDIANF